MWSTLNAPDVTLAGTMFSQSARLRRSTASPGSVTPVRSIFWSAPETWWNALATPVRPSTLITREAAHHVSTPSLTLPYPSIGSILTGRNWHKSVAVVVQRHSHRLVGVNGHTQALRLHHVVI